MKMSQIAKVQRGKKVLWRSFLFLTIFFFQNPQQAVAHPCMEPHIPANMTPANIARCYSEAQDTRFGLLRKRLQIEKVLKEARDTGDQAFIEKVENLLQQSKEDLRDSGWPGDLSLSDLKNFERYDRNRIVSIDKSLIDAKSKLKILTKNYDKLRKALDQNDQSVIRQMKNLSKQLDQDAAQLAMDSTFGFIDIFELNIDIALTDYTGIPRTKKDLELIKEKLGNLKKLRAGFGILKEKDRLKQIGTIMEQIGSLVADGNIEKYAQIKPAGAIAAKKMASAAPFFLTIGFDSVAMAQTLLEFRQVEKRLSSSMGIRDRWDSQIKDAGVSVNEKKIQKKTVIDQVEQLQSVYKEF